MQVSVTDAKSQLTDLVRRAEAGDEIVLTRHGHAAVRLVPIIERPTASSRLALMADVARSSAENVTPGPDAAPSQDDLYDSDGLPR